MWASIVDAIEKCFPARPSDEAIEAIDGLLGQMVHCHTRYETYRTLYDELGASERTAVDPKRETLCELLKLKWQMQVTGLVLKLKELGETFSLWSARTQAMLADPNSMESLGEYCDRRLQAVARYFGKEPGIDTYRAVMDTGFSEGWKRLDAFVRARFTDREIEEAHAFVRERTRREPLDRVECDATRLVATHPPQWRHPNKQAVFDLVCSAGSAFEGRVKYSRWPEQRLPSKMIGTAHVDIRPGAFTYSVPASSSGVEWHMNFADPYLFVAYDSALLAQDELQVLEHPILGSLREALDSLQTSGETVDARHRPTPITISGVQRHCAIDTLPDLKAGRSQGLYGNAFARASASQVIGATRLILPTTTSNILAIAAPAGGDGDYNSAEIAYIATAAYTGFLAARWEGAELFSPRARTVIHTGFWGCGAFGGNRVLMTILQTLAAQLAGVDLVFHAFDKAGVALAEEAYLRYADMARSVTDVSEMLATLAREKFQWGESDGN